MMFIFDVAQIAQKSLFYEAALYPKPGLVTPLDSGSHSDMDYKTFIDSGVALLPCFIACTSIGHDLSHWPPPDVLPRLKEAGKQGEKAMYHATGGINTHKGAIFLLGLLCAAVGRLQALQQTPNPVPVAETASLFVQGIVERELKTFEQGNADRGLASCTAGELAYILHRIDGARGEAERGFPTALTALEELKTLEAQNVSERGAPISLQMRQVHVLMGIMADNADSNLVSRGGIEAVGEVRSLAREVLAAGSVWTEEGRARIRDMEKALVAKRLSPGGCADLLSCALFLQMIEGELSA
ncbi:MAG: triphosphoribosyl-dephospho-CoA synthase [Synergistaceae bacterium]|jgi:triphosphoribosyl-dephospho-CoA synthase|nr:triphosphoribosyl-dephospho-CoA synthase [Synergistaceae bacterium]